MPMVWYIPPLSPVADVTAAAGYDDADPDAVFATIDALRVPVEYLANLFTAGRAEPVRAALQKLAVLRGMMRAQQLGVPLRREPGQGGLSDADAEDLFRLLAIARYEDRYVVPPAHAEDAGRLLAQHSLSGCSLESEGGPGMGGTGSFHLTKRDEKGRLAHPRGRGRRMRRQVASAVFGCASVLLSYPEEESFSADLAAVEGALRRLPAGSARSHLESCWRWLSTLNAMGAATALRGGLRPAPAAEPVPHVLPPR